MCNSCNPMDCSLPGFPICERGRQYSRQEYWSGLPWPPLWDLPNPGIEPMSLMSPALAGGFPLALPGKPPTNSQLLYKTSPRQFIKPTFKILAQRLHCLIRHPISMRPFTHSFDHSHSFEINIKHLFLSLYKCFFMLN